MAQVVQAGETYATSGERRAAEELAKLPTNWLVIANKVLPTTNNRSFEIDFIVVGRRMVFVIDEKAWRGKIHGTDYHWVRSDGASQKSPLNKVDYVAKIVAGHLNNRTAGFDKLSRHTVAGCVLLTEAGSRPSISDPRASKGVLLLDEVVEKLQQRDANEGDPGVETLRDRIKDTFVNLAHRPNVPKQINGYTIVDNIDGPGGARLFTAEHIDGGARALTMYEVARDDPKRDFYLQEYKTLSQLTGKGVAPQVQDPFQWSEDFLVIPSQLPEGSTLAALPPPVSEAEALGEIEIAAAAFESLAVVHDQGMLHRALSPSVIHISHQGGKPRVTFSRFFAARTEQRTIAPQLDALLLDDPYAAPELKVGYGYADQGSDTYSLAVVVLEQLSGLPVGALSRDAYGVCLVPALNQGWSYLPEATAAELRAWFSRAITPGTAASPSAEGSRRLDATTCADELTAILTRARPKPETRLGDVFDHRYEIVRILGTGASARTFLARDIEADGVFTLKQFLRPTMLSETSAAKHEFNFLRLNSHPRIPHVYDLYPLTNDAHIKIEYIEGQKLSEAMDQYYLQLGRFRALASDLLDALQHLEQHELLHRDVKPDNIIIQDSTGHAFLIDFGSAAPFFARVGAAGTPMYIPPEAYWASEPPPSSDRYAAAVVLFEALTGRLPFTGNGSDLNQEPLRQGDILNFPEEVRRCAEVLLQAVSLEPERRHPSAAGLHQELMRALEPDQEDAAIERRLDEQSNPTVDALRGLFRNSSRGNADNRGLDSPFARDTYVLTALDERLLPDIFDQEPRAVFLTGNPGDGKTAFLGQVQTTIEQQGGTRVSSDESGWEWMLNGRSFRACYDASEAHEGQSADEQLRGRLRGLEGVSVPSDHPTVLVAINDGRLADFINRHREQFGWLAAEIDRTRGQQPNQNPGGAWVIDLKRRAFVSLDPHAGPHSVMRRILAELVAPERWSICGACIANPVCPIRRNAGALDATEGGTVAQRLEHLLLLAHLRGQHHLTIRDLRSGLAYLITGDQSCADIHQARNTGTGLPEIEFWRLAFSTPTARDIMLGELTPMDAARSPQPFLERFLFFHQSPGDASLRGRVFQDGQDIQPLANAVEWLSTIKRRLYFHTRLAGDEYTDAPLVPWASLLPYHHAGAFINAVRGADLGPVLESLLQGISRSDGLSGPILEHGLCLKIADSDVNRLTVLKVFPFDQFRLTVQGQPATGVVETLPEALVLTHTKSRARVVIMLDLFEILYRLAEGMEPASPELEPLLEDLASFKSTVQLSDPEDLILIESGRSLHRLTQRNGKVVREDIIQEASVR